MKTFTIYTTNVAGGFFFVDFPNTAISGRLYYRYGNDVEVSLIGGVSAVTASGFTINIPSSILLSNEILLVRVELSNDNLIFNTVATGEFRIGEASNPEDLLGELQQKLEPGQTVTLHPSSLNALEEITVNEIQNMVSVANSTTTPLMANEVFVGEWEDVKDFESLSIMLRSDKPSATDGALLEWSDDGVNVRRSSISSVTGSTTQGFFFTSPRQARYYRAKYINGNQDQGTFAVQIIHNTSTAVGSVIPILGPLDTAVSGLLVRSVLTGQTSAGGTTFANVKVNPSGTLEVNANQNAHDSFNANANVQVGNADASVANPLPVSLSSEREYTHIVATVTASGDTVIHTPASGMSVRVHYVKVEADPVAVTMPLSKVKLGSTEIYRAYNIDVRQRKTGPVDGAVTINLSAAGSVAVTIVLEEV